MINIGNLEVINFIYLRALMITKEVAKNPEIYTVNRCNSYVKAEEDFFLTPNSITICP